MPTYATEYARHLRTNQPFTFEVPQKDLERFELQKRLVEAGQAPMLGSLKNVTIMFEFSLFPSYNLVLKIWIQNGFSTDLITAILKDFGADESFIDKVLEDEDFIAQVRPYFEGVTYDGGRAARTLHIVYEQIKAYYSVRPQPDRTLDY